jgi:hypothetical protein
MFQGWKEQTAKTPHFWFTYGQAGRASINVGCIARLQYYPKLNNFIKFAIGHFAELSRPGLGTTALYNTTRASTQNRWWSLKCDYSNHTSSKYMKPHQLQHVTLITNQLHNIKCHQDSEMLNINNEKTISQTLPVSI